MRIFRHARPDGADPRTSLVRLRARPQTLYTSRGRTVLATDREGCVSPEENQGLFVHETRIVSRLRYRLDGQAPEPVALSNVEQHTWLGYYIVRAPGGDEAPDTGSGRVPSAAQEALELRVSRSLGEGMHEDVDVTSCARYPSRFELAIEVAADFADALEAGGERKQRGRVQSRWIDDKVLEVAYRAQHTREGGTTRRIERALVLRLSRAPDDRRRGVLRFRIALAPGETWHLCLDFAARIDGEDLAPQYRCRSFFGSQGDYDERTDRFAADALRVDAPRARTLEPVVVAALDQAQRDLVALRLYDLDGPAHESWVPAAGLPQFVALFGRDTLTAAWQSALLGPEMMTGTLAQLARLQGTRDDPWRDEEPGRMLHEVHTGPLSALDIVPNGRSYSSMTTSGFYAFLVSQLWHWTGRKEQVEPFVEPALAALRWLDRHHRTPRGFYAYATRSPQGVRHQGWKDSGDAIVDAQGHDVAPPLATCEEQAFVYVAKLFFAELLWWLDRGDDASRLRREADELKARFIDTYWMPREGFVAMAVDSADRQVPAIGSNAGHCLAAGILASDQVTAVADRLMRPDLFSGWGIRTLSADNPAFNPYSYHRGSVWPVEQGPFALGFMRYGLHTHVERLSRAVFECSALFDSYRLPEVLSGHARDADHPFPAIYPGACSPQAWSSSTLFSLLQAMLGLYPYAPLHVLALDPHLPEWLPELSLRGLRVGDARVDLRFTRRLDGTTDFDVEERVGRLHILHQPSPWSLTADIGERLHDLMTSVV